MSSTIMRIATPGAEVDAFIRDHLYPVVAGQPIPLVVMSFFVLMLSTMGPEDITEDELTTGAQEMSSTLALYLSGLRTDPAELKN